MASTLAANSGAQSNGPSTAAHDGEVKNVNSYSDSDDEEDDDETEIEGDFGSNDTDPNRVNELRGTLSKWTNYIHGWQDRCVVLKDGVMSYYKNEDDLASGCRGAVHLARAIVTLHQFDECRFDVTLGDSVWYLRAPSEPDRLRWVAAVEQHKLLEAAATGNVPGNESGGLRRHPSLLSITSATSLSTQSNASFKRSRQLRETLSETATYRDLLCRQLDILQSYFDSCASAMALYQKSILDEDHSHDPGFTESHDSSQSNSQNTHQIPGHYVPPQFPQLSSDNNQNDPSPASSASSGVGGVDIRDFTSIFRQHGSHAIDFKSEAAAFKATTVAIVQNIATCIELVQQREDQWKRKLEKEIERRKKLQTRYEEAQKAKKRFPPIEGPDFEEGPNCRLNEDEFYDAVDFELDKIEKQILESKSAPIIEVVSSVKLSTENPLYHEVDALVREYMDNCKFSLPESKDWELLAEDGAMKVFRREYERDGVVLDPLKAVNCVKGLTGKEFCQYFFDPAIKMEWEVTLEHCKVAKWLSEDTVLLYQIMKRVWPTTQRDCLYWSHIRHLVTEEGGDYWIVINHSTTDEEFPSTNKYCRCHFTVAMVCETTVTPPEEGKPITRDHVNTKIAYMANVNPGGYVPPGVLRMVYKREYPRFLRRFTDFVREKTNGKPVLLH